MKRGIKKSGDETHTQVKYRKLAQYKHVFTGVDQFYRKRKSLEPTNCRVSVLKLL